MFIPMKELQILSLKKVRRPSPCRAEAGEQTLSGLKGSKALQSTCKVDVPWRADREKERCGKKNWIHRDKNADDSSERERLNPRATTSVQSLL